MSFMDFSVLQFLLCSFPSRSYWNTQDSSPVAMRLRKYYWPLISPQLQAVCNRRWRKASTSWLQTLDTDFLHARIEALVLLWDKLFNANDDYVYYLLHIWHVYIKVRIKVSPFEYLIISLLETSLCTFSKGFSTI